MRKLVNQMIVGVGIVLLTGCGKGEQQQVIVEELPSMQEMHDEVHAEYEKNKELVRESLVEIWNKNNIDVLGNGQSIYFIKENKEIIGMNYLESSNIYLSFNKIK